MDAVMAKLSECLSAVSLVEKTENKMVTKSEMMLEVSGKPK